FPLALAHVRKTVSPSGYRGLRAFDSLSLARSEGIPGRRSMPQFNFSDEDLDALAEFLKYTSEIDTAGWPPNIQG
ncbi:hypothetical protein BOW52_10145, partial [Solemya elarraichensis gill symbiont]